MRPEVGSRWYAADHLAIFKVTGWTDQYGGMVVAETEGARPRLPVYLRPEDFGVRLLPAKASRATEAS